MQMLIDVFRKRKDEAVHDLIFFICICIFIIGLPTSRFLVSASQMLMGISWLAGGNYIEKIKRFWRNKAAVYLCAIYFIYLIGMFWTHNLSYGFGFDLQNKLPILTLTFLLASSRPINSDRAKALLVIFSLSVLFSSFVGLYIFLSHDVYDARELSPFMIHIYLGMMVLLTMFLLPWIIRQISGKSLWYYLSLVSSLWLLVFFVMLSSLTVFVCLGGVLIYLAVREVFFQSNITRRIIAISATLAFIIIAASIVFYVTRPLLKEVDYGVVSSSDLTSEGNKYTHNLNNPMRENGYPVYQFIAENELRMEWNERSELDFDSLDYIGQSLKHTLYRYLTSKGLHKDREGLSMLEEREIHYIENGIANYLYTKWPNALVRIHQTFWELQEYQRTGNPSGYTMAQRIELWKASVVAFKKYPVLGWGTGDVLMAIEFGLTSSGSKLKNFDMKPHNQILNLLLMTGVAGLIVFFSLYSAFVFKTKPYRYLPYNIFLIIILISMMSTNPIDNQMGLSFALFFSMYFGFMHKE